VPPDQKDFTLKIQQRFSVKILAILVFSAVLLAQAQTDQATPCRKVNGQIYRNDQLPYKSGSVLFNESGIVTLAYSRYGGEAGERFALTNYTGEIVADKTISARCLKVGIYNWGSQPLELFDCGTPYLPPPPTPEEIAAQEKTKMEAKAKAAGQKQAATARALQSNQTAAAKGDSFGLLRMGERYRDGDGVEKDLSKARDYLQKAADAGSITAKDELEKLNPPAEK